MYVRQPLATLMKLEKCVLYVTKRGYHDTNRGIQRWPGLMTVQEVLAEYRDIKDT